VSFATIILCVISKRVFIVVVVVVVVVYFVIDSVRELLDTPKYDSKLAKNRRVIVNYLFKYASVFVLFDALVHLNRFQ
jgi:hypothetical protein